MFALSDLEAEALALSLRVALVSAAVSLPPGIGMACLLARCRFPGKSVVDAIIHLPMVLPPVVVGYALLVLLGRRGIAGAWLHDVFGITLAFTWKGAAVAAAVMAFPLMVRAMRLSLESIDRGLEAAARTLGANPVRVFLTVTLPLMSPGIVAGLPSADGKHFLGNGQILNADLQRTGDPSVRFGTCVPSSRTKRSRVAAR